MKVLPYGPQQCLIRWDRHEQFAAASPSLFAKLDTDPPEGLIEYVPGYQTILLQFRQPYQKSAIEEYLRKLSAAEIVAPASAELIKVPVIYDGPDLVELAETHQLTPDEVICRHSDPIYTVQFMGFSPGFPYLGPLDTTLHTPRRDSPRTHIPAGSVAIGGSHTGIYSVASPGGWHIIGRTSFPLFNRDAASIPQPDTRSVFALHPGDQVQLIPHYAKDS